MLHIKLSLSIVVKKEQESGNSSATDSVVRNGDLDLKSLASIVSFLNLIYEVFQYFIG